MIFFLALLKLSATAQLSSLLSAETNISPNSIRETLKVDMFFKLFTTEPQFSFDFGELTGVGG